MISPGFVRRSWWRSSQTARLAVAGLGVVTTVATTGAIAFNGVAVPGMRAGSGLEANLRRGDSVEVTVHAVSEVDSFEGAEPGTGLLVRARVTGVRRVGDCWQAESRAAARNLLLGKEVRLVIRRDDSSGGDQIMVDVLLPNGDDYARTVVRDGAASADPSTREDLAPVESDARHDRRGVWATSCAPAGTEVTATSAPPTAAQTTTVTATTVPAPAESPPPRPSSAARSSTPPDDLWVGILRGRRCTSEGERRTSITGGEMVCAHNDKGELRWRRE
ncbi:thermonuclease family protein [Lentzea sp. NPDC051208]|uniref:thermonuclease family protein n=1 Tax=Lentzea sp. NPDC051208 TaxID=3154642 RepID=UPI00342459E1